jgi:transcriptional regulator GlxA family with amidase domain
MRGHRPPHLVVMVLYDQVQTLDVSGPLDVFAAANDGGGRYRLLTASPGGRTVRTLAGLRMAPDAALEDVTGRIGTLIVPGRADWQAAIGDRRLVTQIARLATNARRVASVCAGAFPLAATGMLDGHRVATHWKLARALAETFPGLEVERESIYVRDGRVMTSAGVSAGIDLALALVEEDLGPEVARATARHLVVFMARSGAQSQLSVRLRIDARDPLMRRVLDTVTADPGADHSRAAMAARAGVSVRHLTRLFRTELGMTAARFVEQTRVEAAAELLRSGDDTLCVIARRAGFGSEETMRRAFRRELGVAPSTYRTRSAQPPSSAPARTSPSDRANRPHAECSAERNEATPGRQPYSEAAVGPVSSVGPVGSVSPVSQ